MLAGLELSRSLIVFEKIMRQQMWRELFTRASSEEGSASKQLAPHLLSHYVFQWAPTYARPPRIYLSCHAGTRPVVHGAPTVSRVLSSFARSTSVRVFSIASATLNSSAAISYCPCCDCEGRRADRRMR